jgi:hypothetical protein
MRRLMPALAIVLRSPISRDSCRAPAIKSMRDHPWPAGGKAFGAVLSLAGHARGFPRTARASGAVRRLERRQRARLAGASLVGRMGEPRRGGNRRAMRRCQNDAWCKRAARRTVRGTIALGHRPDGGEGPAPCAEIFINWHCLILVRTSRTAAHDAAVPDALRCLTSAHKSGDIGMSIALVMCLVGPAAFGITSKAKISVGSHSVAQALGISTTPDMCPCTGAVPRMA